MQTGEPAEKDLLTQKGEVEENQQGKIVAEVLKDAYQKCAEQNKAKDKGRTR